MIGKAYVFKLHKNWNMQKNWVKPHFNLPRGVDTTKQVYLLVTLTQKRWNSVWSEKVELLLQKNLRAKLIICHLLPVIS